jgi:hypothetical protein
MSLSENPIIRPDGSRWWFNDQGQLHREDGPAVILPDGQFFFYTNGQAQAPPHGVWTPTQEEKDKKSVLAVLGFLQESVEQWNLHYPGYQKIVSYDDSIENQISHAKIPSTADDLEVWPDPIWHKYAFISGHAVVRSYWIEEGRVRIKEIMDTQMIWKFEKVFFQFSVELVSPGTFRVTIFILAQQKTKAQKEIDNFIQKNADKRDRAENAKRMAEEGKKKAKKK